MGSSGFIPVIGIDVVTGDARYWKLDCSNGPSVGNWNHQGNFLIGAAGVTNPDPTLLYPDLYVGKNANSCGITGAAFANAGSSYPRMSLLKGRGTHAIPAAVLANDYLGSVDFWGQRDATVGHISQSAQIISMATKNWSVGDTASEIAFFTTAQGTTGHAKRLTIADTGDLIQHTGTYQQKDGAAYYDILDFTDSTVGGLTANRTLTVDLKNVSRNLIVSGNATISQDYSTLGTPQFARGGYGVAAHAVDILSVTQAANDASAYALNIVHSGTGASSAALNILHSGLVAGGLSTVYGQRISVTGANAVNIGLDISCTGSINAYSIYSTAGSIYIANSNNTTGIVFGSLGTATRGIDLSGAGLDTTDSYLYLSSTNYWNGYGNLYVGGAVYCNVYGAGGNTVTVIAGNYADGANAFACKIRNGIALTAGAKTVAGTDRYITGFYNNNGTTLQAWIASNGVYGQRDGATYFGLLGFSSSVALATANRMLTIDLVDADRTLKFGNAHIANADAGTIVAQFNTLLSELETAGIILAA